MNNNSFGSVIHNAKHRRIIKRSLAALCAVVLLFTMHSLRRDANTMERIPACGYTEHLHSASCYDADALTCGLEEHVHTDACYQATPDSMEIDELDMEMDDPVVEDLDISLDMQNCDLVTEEIITQPAANEVETRIYSLGTGAMVSRIIEAVGLDISLSDIIEVGAVENDEADSVPIAVEKVDSDYRVWAKRDFAEAELALVLEKEVLVVELRDGVAQTEATASGERGTVGDALDEPAGVAGQPPVGDEASVDEHKAGDDPIEQPAIEDVAPVEDAAPAGQASADDEEDTDATDGQQSGATAPAEDESGKAVLAGDEEQTGETVSDEKEPQAEDEATVEHEKQEDQQVAGEAVDAQGEEQRAGETVGEQGEAQPVNVTGADATGELSGGEAEEEHLAGESDDQPAEEEAEDQSEEQPGEETVKEQPTEEAVGEQGEEQPEEEDAVEQPEEEDATDQPEEQAGEEVAEAEAVGEATEAQPDQEAEEAQSTDEAGQPVYTTIIDLARDKAYPLSLNAMLALAESEQEDEQPEEQPVAAQDEESAEENREAEQTAAQPAPAIDSIEYDETLLSIAESEGDYRFMPIQSFDSTRIIVTNGSMYVLTLVNCVLADEAGVEQAYYPAQDFEGHTDYVKVTVSAPEGAFPEGTTMTVTDVEDEKTITDIEETVSESFVEVKRVHAVDISFWDGEMEIEPLVPISVVISVAEIEESQDAVVVHVDNRGETEVIESQNEAPAGETEVTVEMPASDATFAQEEQEQPAGDSQSVKEGKTDAVAFSADSFSVYAVVVTETIETRYMDVQGETWNISVGFSKEANIPEGATLAVSEVTDDAYLAGAEAALDGGKRVTMARFFDISILDEDGEEIQPDAPVQVNITLDNGETPVQEADGHVIDNGEVETVAMHFDEADQVSDTVAISDGNIVFNASGFSVWGVVYTVDFYYGDYEYHLDGGAYMSLADLAEALEISADGQTFVNGVESVAFTSPELLSVSRVDADTTVADIKASLALACEYSGALTREQLAEIDATTVSADDWALISLKAFDTHEALNITMKNGEKYEISVDDEQLSTWLMTADGETFAVTVTYGPEAEIPAGAKLEAKEIAADSEEYKGLIERAGKALAESNESLGASEDKPLAEPGEPDLAIEGQEYFDAGREPEEAWIHEIVEARLFDISILADGAPMEPAAAVQVSIAYVEPMGKEADDIMTVVHFADTGTEILVPDIMADENGVSEVRFETQSFSNFATIRESMYANSNIAEGLIAYFSFDTYNDMQGRNAAGNVVAKASPSVNDSLGAVGYSENGMNLTTNSGGTIKHFELQKSNGSALLDGNINNALTVSYWANMTVSTAHEWGFFIYPRDYDSDSNPDNVNTTQAYGGERYLGVVHNGTSTTVMERYDSNYGFARGNGKTDPGSITGTGLNAGDHLWHHIVAVYGEGYMELYIDGKKAGRRENPVSLAQLFKNGSVFQVGLGNWGSGEYFIGRIDEIGVYNYALSQEEIENLYSAYVPTVAVKVSAEEAVRQAKLNPNAQIIVYSRLPVYVNGVKKDGEYQYYAITGDGTIRPITDFGDTIGWRGGGPLEWQMTVHTEDGEDNGYYDFRNIQRNNYLAPQLNSHFADSPVGLTMSGLNSGSYGTTIEGWDDSTMSWCGMEIEPSLDRFARAVGDDSAEFYFAVVNPLALPPELTTVDTVDNDLHGITMKMFNYPYGYKTNNDERSYVLQGYFNTEYMPGNARGGIVTPGLVSRVLDKNGLPQTSSGGSLAELFGEDSRYFVSQANHLFIQRIYDETGYYEYDSGNNYAYLNPDTQSFDVYRQTAIPIGSTNNGHIGTSTAASAHKGNFLPFDSLREEGVRVERNLERYDGDGVALPATDPRYDTDMYYITQPDYFFGMSLEADFYQPKNGLVNGETAIFEFNGDDDMWVFIDDALILDIGGIHGAIRGTINFKTGEVYVQGDKGYTKTLGMLFKEAGVFPDGTAWDDSRASSYFKPVTFNGNTEYGPFKDYSAHKLRYYYLERGAGASNLRVRFNTPALQPGAFVVEKEMPEDVQSEYGDKVFAFVVAQNMTNTEGQEYLAYYSPEAGKSVTFEGTDRVAYDSSWTYAQIKDSGSVDIININGIPRYVYYIHPGEALVFPVPDNSVEYDVWEVVLDTGEIKKVEINDTEADFVSYSGQAGEPLDTVKAGLSTVKNRGRVVFNNIPDDSQVGNLRITKHSDSPVIDEDATFSFNVKLEDNKTGKLVPYYKGEYYIVKPVDGVDHYFRYEGGHLVDNGTTPFAFVAGVSGSMSKIPVGYSALIPNLLAGTDFYVEERFDEMDGYTHISTEVGTNTAGAGGIEDAGNLVISQGTIIAGETTAVEANVNITNRPTGRIVAEKIWNSGEYVKKHGDVQVALFRTEDRDEKREVDGVIQPVTVRSYVLVEGTVKPFYDATKQQYRVEYYVPEGVIDDYVVREVKVTTNGSATTVTPILDGGWITVSGEKLEDDSIASNLYNVSYVVGAKENYTYHVSLDDATTATRTGHTRTDTITNTLPKFSAKKTDLENKALNGAVFKLERIVQNGTGTTVDSTFAQKRYTSQTVDGVDGVLFAGLYLSEGTYLLTETSAPAGYNMLTKPIKITVDENGLSVGYGDGSDATNLHVTGTTDMVFSIPNTPGARLPATGGSGTTLYVILGSALVLLALALFLHKRSVY